MVDQFIKNLIECLDYENANRIRIYNEPQLDIPFLTAALQQHLSNKKYSSFLEDLSKYDYSIFYYDNEKDNYSDGYILVELFNKNDGDKFYNPIYCDYKFKIIFNTDDRMDGYCFCTSSDEDYDTRYNCCGHTCDWSAPQFVLQKIENIGSDSFNGDQHDYWDYKDKFIKMSIEENERLERLLKIRQLQELKADIEKQLEELEEERDQ